MAARDGAFNACITQYILKIFKMYDVVIYRDQYDATTITELVMLFDTLSVRFPIPDDFQPVPNTKFSRQDHPLLIKLHSKFIDICNKLKQYQKAPIPYPSEMPTLELIDFLETNKMSFPLK